MLSRGRRDLAVRIDTVKSEEIYIKVAHFARKLHVADSSRDARGDGARLRHSVACVSAVGLLVGYRRAKGEIKLARLARLELYDERIIGVGREILSCIRHAAVFIFNARDRRLYIKIARIIADGGISVPEIYVGLREAIETAYRILRAAARHRRGILHGLLGYLYSLGLRPAEDVGSEISVADRKRPALPRIVRGTRRR